MFKDVQTLLVTGFGEDGCDFPRCCIEDEQTTENWFSLHHILLEPFLIEYIIPSNCLTLKEGEHSQINVTGNRRNCISRRKDKYIPGEDTGDDSGTIE